MSAALEQAAKKLVADPQWSKVFKNTWDIMEGGINQCLLIVGIVAMAIRFASNIGSGHLVCILIDVEGSWNMTDIGGPMAATYAAYASLDPGCYNTILSWFDTYGSFILMLEAILLVAAEKVNKIVPNLNQKLQRFYKTVVEEMMLGKDPDVAEDIVEGVVSTDKILRSRQRREICGALRGSSTIYHLYIGKNMFQVVLACAFLFMNWYYGLNEEHNREEGKICRIELKETDKIAKMQCRQKWLDFFVYLLFCQMCFLVLSICCNLGSLIWAIEDTGLRRMTNIIRTLQKKQKQSNNIKKSNSLERKKSTSNRRFSLGRKTSSMNALQQGISMEESEQTKGEDLYFLFDLLAHSCGDPATLRVLSHTDDMFAKLCQPDITFNVSETCLEVEWTPAPLQNIEGFVRDFEIEKYSVTIIAQNTPPETKEVAKCETKTTFTRLDGGNKKYDVTLSVIIQKAIMKGSRTSTYLLPYPPQKLSLEPLPLKDKSAQVCVKWTRPKGGFEKYSLKVCHVAPKRASVFPSMVGHFTYNKQDEPKKEPEIWIPDNKEKTEGEYTVGGLLPGERYFVELRSVTGGGSRYCKEDQSLKKSLLTTPMPPKNIDIYTKYDVDTKTCHIKLSWDPPSADGHSLIDGYSIELKDGDKQIGEEILSKKYRQVTLTKVDSAKKYSVGIATICRASTKCDTLPSDGNLMGDTEYFERKSKFTYLEAFTPPNPPSNLKLESTTPTKLNIKWDPPTSCASDMKVSYSLSIQPRSSYVRDKMEEKTYENQETTKFSFGGLPEPVGSGEPYEISVKANITLDGKKLKSVALTGVFYTKPLPPERLYITDAETQEIAWYRSPSPNVKNYKIKLKGENDKSGEDTWVSIKPHEVGETISNQIQHKIQRELELNVEYKVNIYSEIEVQREGRDSIWVESEPLFMKLMKQNEPDTQGDVTTDVTGADVCDLGTVERIVLLKANLITRKHTYITEGAITRQSVLQGNRPMSTRGSAENLPTEAESTIMKTRRTSYAGIPRQTTISEDQSSGRQRKISNVRPNYGHL